MDGTSHAALFKAHLIERFLLRGELYGDNAINKKLISKRKLRSAARTREEVFAAADTVMGLVSTQSAPGIAKLLEFPGVGDLQVPD